MGSMDLLINYPFLKTNFEPPANKNIRIKRIFC